jgi:hypothetical protein
MLGQDDCCIPIEQTNAACAQQTGKRAFWPRRSAPIVTRAVEACLTFAGQLDPEAFRAFAERRAARLSLSYEAHEATAARFVCRLRGHAALVDMFEMACSLGPLTCIVRDVARDERALETEAGRD